jgi:excisionase family DNA binding protein
MLSNLSQPDTFLKAPAVALVLGCTSRTVTRLCTNGVLPATRLGPGRTSWRVRSADLMAFIHRYGHHEPADVAESPDPDQLPTPAPPPGLLTRRRTAEGLQLVELCSPPADSDKDA